METQNPLDRRQEVGIVAHEHTPPRLSDEGAELLADVLAKRNPNAQDASISDMSRHDTPSARANARRRERHPLRDPSAPVIDVVDVGSSRPSDDDSALNTRSHAFILLMAGVGLGVLIVGLAIVIARSPGPESTPTVEVAGALEARPEGPTSTARSSVTPALAIDASEIEVMIFDVDPQINGVRSFVLELKSVATQNAVPTDDFDVVVVREDGTMAMTFVRFESGELAAGSSASATVRAEGVAGRGLEVVVRLGDTEIARIPLV